MLTPISVFERIKKIDRPDGGRMELWLNVRDIARKIVEANNLRPLSAEAVATYARLIDQPLIEEAAAENLAAPQMKSLSREAVAKIFDPDIRGGMRTPHLHLDGKIFLLEGKAYQEFSRQLISTVQERISAAGTIPFNQLLDVSEASIGI